MFHTYPGEVKLVICLFMFCPHISLVTSPVPPVHSLGGGMQTDGDFYLSGLSGTVLEILTAWKAVVGFRRKDKDEKAVLLGLF